MPERWANRAMQGAFARGARAAEAGVAADANPYRDRRGDSGQVTFSRAFRRAWREGWDSVRRHVAR